MSGKNNSKRLFADEERALKILDYWFTMEFLNQQSLKAQMDTGKQAYRYKNAYKSRRAKKRKTLSDFIEIRPGDTLNGIVKQNIQDTGMPVWSEFTIFIGKMKKEACIQEIAKNVDWEDRRPENNYDEIALAALRFGKTGRYLAGSLSVSPLAWAVKRLSGGTENASEKLSTEEYFSDTRALEEKIRGLLEPIEESERQAGNTLSEQVSEGITWELLAQIEKMVYEQLPGSDQKAEGSFLAVYYRLYASMEDIEEEENEPGLHFDCYSDDLSMAAEKLRKQEISEEKKKVLLDYILGLYRLDGAKEKPERFDLVKPEDKEELYRFMLDTLTAEKAPLGKWPSKFMPALMQQIAVNLAVNETAPMPVFSVNGPPGTGKTTLLKEIIVNHIIEKARLLAACEDPDDAFDDRTFRHGDKPQHSYNKYVQKYHRLKDKRIHDYSILVASSNNTAVENITKELPLERKLLGDIAPSKDKSGDKNNDALGELTRLFTVSESSGTLAHAKQVWEEYTDAGGKTKKRSRTVAAEEPDIYFSRLATDLLNNEFEKKEREQAFGLISASLGKKTNIAKVQESVIAPLLVIMKKNESIDARKKTYILAREKFLSQVRLVQELQKKQDRLAVLFAETAADAKKVSDGEQDILSEEANFRSKAQELDEQIRKHQAALDDFRQQTASVEAAMRNAEAAVSTLEEKVRFQQNNINASAARIEALRSNVSGLGKMFKTAKYRENQAEIDRALVSQAQYMKEMDACNEELQRAAGEQRELVRRAEDLRSGAAAEEKEIRLIQSRRDAAEKKLQEKKDGLSAIKNCLEQQKAACSRELENYRRQDEFETGFVPDRGFIEDLLSDDIDRSTEAQVKNPWFSEHYNREREKLFLYALQMTKEFILGSKKCRDNFKHLNCLWCGSYEDGASVRFADEDLDACTMAAYETLFLLIPVVSSTFASVQNLFRNAREENVIGTLIVDEAGQASPHMAAGALYRAKKAIIVGDPKQVEPVVTDDQDLLKQTYTEDFFRLYADKTNSVQRFADLMNPYGTCLENKAGEQEWVGCPLLVHRRCISPMYDISNDISYNNIMKQKTLPPKKEKTELFLADRSQWINVIGSEMGRKNHFVPEQGDKVIELLEMAYQKSDTPDLYIISPFKSVVTGVADYIKKYAKAHPDSRLAQASGKGLQSWLRDNIGTVHKFQGKEAAEVIFLLGCDTSAGALPAVRWVNNNIVNVAATRAKYRLYVIGDIRAWKESRCVSRAKAIIDTYAFEAIEKELKKEHVDSEKLVSLCGQIPAGTAFPVQRNHGEAGEEDEYVPSTAEVIEELDQANIMTRELTGQELQRFGFRDLSEVLAFSPEIRSNLLWGMKLYLLLEEAYAKSSASPDASCCGILFCKAIEIRMHECFAEALKVHFPDYQMRTIQNQNNPEMSQIVYLKDADIKEFTLGWYPAFIKKKKAELGTIMDQNGYPEYDKTWWDDFKSKLFQCKNERNSCCHTGLFDWSHLEELLAAIFETTETKHDGVMRGLLFESGVGLLMNNR